MAGILDFLGGGSPQGGILGAQMQAAPAWTNTVGMIGAALKDAGASLNGRDSNSVAQFQQFQRQNQLRQAYALAANGDPSQRPQAYAAILANGGDPSALQKYQAQAALPQLMANLQPSEGFNDNPVGVTPAANAAGPGVDAARTAALQTNAAPAMSMQPATFSGALQRTGSPELTAEMAPQLIRSQMDIQAKSVHRLTPQQAVAAGYPADAPVFSDQYGNISSEAKPTAVLKQTQDAAANAPLTPYQKAMLGRQSSEQAEKVREFNLTNPMAASGGGGAISPDITTYAPQVQSTVKAMLEGRQAPPTSFALSKPYWQNLMAIANAVDPNFDQTAWGARASARKDLLGGGKGYQTLNAGNTAIQHLGRLNEQIGSVAGHQIPLIGNYINQGENAVAKASGVPGVPAYNDTLGHVSEETTKFYRGSGGAEADVVRNMGNLSADLSTEQKKAGVQNTVHLIYGKLAPMVEQYNKTMGTDYPASHFLSKQSIATMQRMGYDPDTGEQIQSRPGAGVPTNPQDLPRIGAKKTIRFEDLP